MATKYELSSTLSILLNENDQVVFNQQDVEEPRIEQLPLLDYDFLILHINCRVGRLAVQLITTEGYLVLGPEVNGVQIRRVQDVQEKFNPNSQRLFLTWDEVERMRSIHDDFIEDR